VESENDLGPYKPKEMNVTDVRGPITFGDQSIYTGEWNTNLKEGKGIKIWKDGMKFEGYWKNNKANGKG